MVSPQSDEVGMQRDVMISRILLREERASRHGEPLPTTDLGKALDAGSRTKVGIRSTAITMECFSKTILDKLGMSPQGSSIALSYVRDSLAWRRRLRGRGETVPLLRLNMNEVWNLRHDGLVSADVMPGARLLELTMAMAEHVGLDPLFS